MAVREHIKTGPYARIFDAPRTIAGGNPAS